MSATRVLLQLQRPSPRIPNASLSWRDLTVSAIADMVTFALHDARALLEGAELTGAALAGPASWRIPDGSEVWRVDLHRPAELPRRVMVATAEMFAMAATSSTRVLLVLERPSPRIPTRTLSWPCRLGLAAVATATAVSLLVLLATGAAFVRRDARQPSPSESPRMVFIATQDAPASGGGGGGNRQTTPVTRTMPPTPREQTQRIEPTPVRPPIETRTVVWDPTPVAGLPTVEAVAASAASGSGESSGVGTGDGNGAGPGNGPGQGPGKGGGEGGGVYQLGGSVIAPVLISQVRPNYTALALAQHLEGSVLLEVVIRSTGLPDAIRVLRSLDPHGLDEEAIGAVRQWRFRPGRIGTTPVDVLVTCIVDFHLR